MKVLDFKHGQRCTCMIGKTEIVDAKISIEEIGYIFICQNIKAGHKAKNLSGYQHSWLIYTPFAYKTMDESLKFYKVTDLLLDDEGSTDKIRTFESGATRDADKDKLGIEGFFSPLVIKRRAEYMHKHRIQPDGKLRSADNWQKGMDKDSYIESLLRHILDLWLIHDGYPQLSRDKLEDVLCAISFNSDGYLYEIIKEKASKYLEKDNRPQKADPDLKYTPEITPDPSEGNK